MGNKANNKIGELLDHKGSELIIRKGNGIDDCKRCYFDHIQCNHILCMKEDRNDNENVYFEIKEQL